MLFNFILYILKIVVIYTQNLPFSPFLCIQLSGVEYSHLCCHHHIHAQDFDHLAILRFLYNTLCAGLGISVQFIITMKLGLSPGIVASLRQKGQQIGSGSVLSCVCQMVSSTSEVHWCFQSQTAKRVMFDYVCA